MDGSHFDTMIVSSLIRSITRVLSLALMGLVVAAGAAFAHEGYRPAVVDVQRVAVQADHTVGHAAYRSSDVATALQTTVSVEPPHAAHSAAGDVPCSEDRADGHGAGTCCTMACHAALPALLVGPVGSQSLPGLRVTGLTNMLVGRSSDRAERPPRIG